MDIAGNPTGSSIPNLFSWILIRPSRSCFCRRIAISSALAELMPCGVALARASAAASRASRAASIGEVGEDIEGAGAVGATAGTETGAGLGLRTLEPRSVLASVGLGWALPGRARASAAASRASRAASVGEGEWEGCLGRASSAGARLGLGLGSLDAGVGPLLVLAGLGLGLDLAPPPPRPRAFNAFMRSSANFARRSRSSSILNTSVVPPVVRLLLVGTGFSRSLILSVSPYTPFAFVTQSRQIGA
mmetsp:Transcript_110440/g.191372  ORF Transcript_110440/g.191372 Transcript_110440/m.191372 type:complete len:247 (-) Transcript_110440:15-755(-)